MKRNVSIDYLKIFSMILVILYHVTIYGINPTQVTGNGIILTIINILKCISIICVNCFILISGYFMCTRTIKYKKIFGLWLHVEAFSLGIYLVLCIIPELGITFDSKTFIKLMFPVLSNQYWFFTNYLLLVIVAPILNIIIQNVSKQKYEIILLVGIVVFSVLPTINIFGDPFGTNKGFSIIWFVMLYLIAAYVRIYPLPRVKYRLLYSVTTIVLFIAITSCHYIASVFPYAMAISNLLLTYNSILVVVASVSIFVTAVTSGSKKEKQYKIDYIIAKIASLSFGVYLLHEHPQIRDILWNEWVRLMDYAHNPLLFCLRIISSTAIIFTIGIISFYVVDRVIAKIVFCLAPVLDKFMTTISNKYLMKRK